MQSICVFGISILIRHSNILILECAEILHTRGNTGGLTYINSRQLALVGLNNTTTNWHLAGIFHDTLSDVGRIQGTNEKRESDCYPRQILSECRKREKKQSQESTVVGSWYADRTNVFPIYSTYIKIPSQLVVQGLACESPKPCSNAMRDAQLMRGGSRGPGFVPESPVRNLTITCFSPSPAVNSAYQLSTVFTRFYYVQLSKVKIFGIQCLYSSYKN